MTDKPLTHEQITEYAKILTRINRVAGKLAGSTLEKNVIRKTDPNVVSGAYLLRSLELCFEQGYNLDETIRWHKEMLETIYDLRREQLEDLDNDRARPDPYPSQQQRSN